MKTPTLLNFQSFIHQSRPPAFAERSKRKVMALQLAPLQGCGLPPARVHVSPDLRRMVRKSRAQNSCDTSSRKNTTKHLHPWT
jgi:hypothetical protein